MIHFFTCLQRRDIWPPKVTEEFHGNSWVAEVHHQSWYSWLQYSQPSWLWEGSRNSEKFTAVLSCVQKLVEMTSWKNSSDFFWNAKLRQLQPAFGDEIGWETHSIKRCSCLKCDLSYHVISFHEDLIQIEVRAMDFFVEMDQPWAFFASELLYRYRYLKLLSLNHQIKTYQIFSFRETFGFMDLNDFTNDSKAPHWSWCLHLQQPHLSVKGDFRKKKS